MPDRVPHRLTLLHSTPRVAAGLLSRDAWQALSEAGTILAADTDEAQPAAIRQSGLAVQEVPAEDGGVPLARLLVERASRGSVVWVGSDDGDPGLTDAIAAEVSSRPDPPEVEVLVGSFDVPGARLLDLVAVMDRLRSPGGCPWDAEQTHESLVPHLLEEAHELAEAIETGDRAHMVEELGDVLLQVAFQARMGQDDRAAPFDIDEVAAGIVGKLVRRHPHVFAGGSADTAAEVLESWEQIKAQEKPHRTSVLEGIPAGMPSLARAAKVLSRLERAGAADTVADACAGDSLGARLLALVEQGRTTGQDAEAALRATLRELEARATLGKLEARATLGKLQARATLGDLEARATLGKLEARATLGKLEARATLGKLEARATPGESGVQPPLSETVHQGRGSHPAGGTVSR